MAYYEPKLKVISPEDCPCEFFRIWGGPYESFWHGYVLVMWTYTGTGKLRSVPRRLKTKLLQSREGY